MAADKSRWKKKTELDSAPLLALEAAWRDWAAEDGLPQRARFDPMHFPDLLPWMILSELTDRPNEKPPYDMYFRYIGTEFARYFNAQSVTRMHLTEVGQPYADRWFAIGDSVKKALGPCYFTGAPLGTGYEYITLEMLALPLAKHDGKIGFILCSFARTEELLL